jgi:3-isopropylmalate dehydrogenase
MPFSSRSFPSFPLFSSFDYDRLVVRIAVIPGDGIGKDVTTEAVKTLNAVAEVSGRRIDLEMLPWGAGPLPRKRHHDSSKRLRDAAGRLRRDPGRSAWRPARARHASCPRHSARHAIRARPLHQLPARETAGRPPLSAEGPHHEGRELRRVSRKHRGRLRRHRAAGSRRARPTRSRFRKRSIPTKGVRRIIVAAFEHAVAHGRKHVCMADKSNADGAGACTLAARVQGSGRGVSIDSADASLH